MLEIMEKIGKVAPPRETCPSLGIGFEKLDRAVFDPEKAYDKVAALGVKWVRLQSGWQRTEKEKGVYDFAWLDGIVDNLLRRGLTPWLCLCYGNGLYTPAAGKVFGAVGCPPIQTEEERAAWSAYVEATVRHFRGRVGWYEVWNEPDGLWCWKHGVSAEEYGRFCRDTAEAVKKADAKAKVIGFAVCSINLPYIKEALDQGLAGCIDAVSFHRYDAEETRAAENIEALRALLDRYDPDIAIVQGESGTQSRYGGAGALAGGLWTERKQAKHLLRNRVLDLRCGLLFSSHFSAMDMIEALNGTVGDRHSYLDYGYFGVIGADFDENGVACGTYTEKPSYYALRNLASLLGGDSEATSLPLRVTPQPSPYVLGQDYDGALLTAAFRKGEAYAFAYWAPTPLMTTDFASTISFSAAGLSPFTVLVDPMNGVVYALREEQKALRALPVLDYPLFLVTDGFLSQEG